MSIDLLNALATGGTVAGALKGLSAIESFLARRNGNGNGTGPTHKFSQGDHDTLVLIKAGVEQLHDDLDGMRRDLRDCLRAKS